MASTRVRTITSTKTFTRIDLLKWQAITALRRAGINLATVEKVRRGIDNRWIEKIAIFGMDANDRAWCKLTLRIDWAKHRLHLAAGATSVSIDDRWTDNTSIELDEALRLFEQYSRSKGLRPLMHVWYTSVLPHAQIRNSLGFVDAKPVTMAGPTSGTLMGIPELDELTIGYDMVI